MKQIVFCIVKSVLSAATVPFWFIRLFRSAYRLPDAETGSVVNVVRRYSMFENVCEGASPALAFAAIAAAAASVILNVLALIFSGNKALHTAGTVVFIAAIALFAAMLLFSFTVSRKF